MRFIRILFLCLTFLPLEAALAEGDFDLGLQHMREGDYAKAFCVWEPLAKLGHPDAQFNLGWLYANGNGLNVSVEDAVYWWQQAANNSHLDAQFAIGLAYTTGEGIKSDLNKAFYWFLTAAKSGHQDSIDIIKRLVLESNTDYYAQYPELYDIPWLRQNLIVTGDVVNIRSAPNTKGKIVFKAKKGDIFMKTAEKDGWFGIKLPDQSQIGWIYGKLTKDSKSN